MKRFFSVFLIVFTIMVFLQPTNFAFALQEQTTFVVTANTASVFSQPDLKSEKKTSLKHNQEIFVEFEGEKAKIYASESGFNFFKSISNDGFVLCDLVTPKSDVMVSIPNFNAQTNEVCKLFLNEDEKLVESQISLEKGERIFLYEGFDSKKEFTAVAVLKDNQVIYGHLKTSVINPDGINPVIITCATVILAVLGIIFALLFMRRKKVKIKIQKKQNS